MARYLKTEPTKLTSYRRLTESTDSPWTKFIATAETGSERVSNYPPGKSSSHRPRIPASLDFFTNPRSPLGVDSPSSPYSGTDDSQHPTSPYGPLKKDDGINPVENLARLNINDTLHSSSSHGSSSSAVSWDSNRSDPKSPTFPKFKRPFALRLVPRQTRSTILPNIFPNSSADGGLSETATKMHSLTSFLPQSFLTKSRLCRWF